MEFCYLCFKYTFHNLQFLIVVMVVFGKNSMEWIILTPMLEFPLSKTAEDAL